MSVDVSLRRLPARRMRLLVVLVALVLLIGYPLIVPGAAYQQSVLLLAFSWRSWR